MVSVETYWVDSSLSGIFHHGFGHNSKKSETVPIVKTAKYCICFSRSANINMAIWRIPDHGIDSIKPISANSSDIRRKKVSESGNDQAVLLLASVFQHAVH